MSAADHSRNRRSALDVLHLCLPSASEEQVKDHYETRIKDKRIQVINPDRPRPGPHPTSKAAAKLKARDRRARMSLKKDREPKENVHKFPMKGRQKRSRSRGIEGLDDKLSYNALIPLATFWESYFQQFAGLLRSQIDPNTGRAEAIPNTAVLKLQAAGQSAVRLWKISDAAITNIQQQACKADLVGASVEVIRAGNPTLVGIRGLVAKETEHVFVVAHRQDERPNARSAKSSRAFKVLPKHNTMLLLKVSLPPPEGFSTSSQQLQIPLQGNQMQGTMTTRATRKWKQKKTLDF